MIFIVATIGAVITVLAFLSKRSSGVAVTTNDMPNADIPEDVGLNPDNNFDTRIILFARAIASAEGFGHAGAIPTKYHNPGDLKPVDGTAAYYTGQSGVGDGGHAIFLNDLSGWNALYRQVRLMATNKSHIYNTQMSIFDVGIHYAEDSSNWAKNVAQFLGVSTETTLQEFFYG